MSRIFFAVVVVALSACGTGINLDTAPVENRTTTNARETDSSKENISPVTDISREIFAKATADRSEGTERGGQNAALDAAGRVVYFDYNSYLIKPEFKTLIETHARFIKEDKSKKVFIEGHTDERGGSEYNLALGQKRAEVVRRALVLLGVADSQLEAVSYGKEKPATTGNTEAAWEKNRRAEISYR